MSKAQTNLSNNTNIFQNIKTFFFAKQTSTNIFIYSILFTFILGILTHGFGLLNFTISHDSLCGFMLSESSTWKISLGRFLVPVVRYVLGDIIVSIWVSGLLGIFFIALSVYFIAQIFDLNNLFELIITSAICVTNISVIALIATYIHDFCSDMIALFFSVLSVYFWKKQGDKISIKYTILIALCIFVPCGLYQSYLQVSATLVVILSVINLLKDEYLHICIRKILAMLLAFGIGIILYFCAATVVSQILSIPFSGDGGNNITYIFNNLLKLPQEIFHVYIITGAAFLRPAGISSNLLKLVVSIFNISLILISGLIVFLSLKQTKKKARQIIAIILLLCLLPIAMCFVMIISTANHHLLRFSIYLGYFLMLVLFKYGVQNLSFTKNNITKLRWLKEVPILMCAFVIFSNIQVANLAYEKKYLQRQATLSTMTRVVYEIEQIDGYIYGESKIMFFGVPQFYLPFETGSLIGCTGVTGQISGASPTRYKNYYKLILQYDFNLCTEAEYNYILESNEFDIMPTYPAKNSISKINDIIVVKFSSV